MFVLNSSESFSREFAQPQLALVMENGSVWEVRSNDQFKTITKNLLIQLPKSRDYHTFLTKNRVLNFVKDDISSNIIQYQKSLNYQNHNKIKKSSVEFEDKINAGFLDFSESTDLFDGLSFKHGIQVGSMFWLVFSQLPLYNPTNPNPMLNSVTMLWFSNKQRWRRGPDLLLPFANFCSSSLNATAILFVFIGNSHTFVTNGAIFNFQYNVWTDIPRMKEKLQGAIMTCTMATLFDKQGRTRVVVLFSQYVIQFNAFSKNILYSVDIMNNNATWKQESTWFQSEGQKIGMYDSIIKFDPGCHVDHCGFRSWVLVGTT